MSVGMYAMKPVFDLDAVVQVPDCMYSLPVIQSSQPIEGVGGQASQPTAACALAALSSRQDNILAKLEQLKEQVSAYQKSLGLPVTSSTSVVKPSSTSSRLAQLKSTMAKLEAMFWMPSSSPNTAMARTSLLDAPAGRTGDLVIRCSPSHPAYSLPAIVSLFQEAGLSVHTTCHSHSSVSNLPTALLSFLPTSQTSRATAQVRLTLIWTDVETRDCELLVSPLNQSVIKGEVNVLRYLARLFPSLLSYESSDCSVQDQLLDSVHCLAWAQPKSRQPILREFSARLTQATFLAGLVPGIADLALFSIIQQLGLQSDLQSEVKKWFTGVTSKFGGQSKNATSKGGKDKKAKSPVKDVKGKKSTA